MIYYTYFFISAIFVRRGLCLLLHGGDDKELLGGYHRAVHDLDDAADGKQVNKHKAPSAPHQIILWRTQQSAQVDTKLQNVSYYS